MKFFWSIWVVAFVYWNFNSQQCQSHRASLKNFRYARQTKTFQCEIFHTCSVMTIMYKSVLRANIPQSKPPVKFLLSGREDLAKIHPGKKTRTKTSPGEFFYLFQYSNSNFRLGKGLQSVLINIFKSTDQKAV